MIDTAFSRAGASPRTRSGALVARIARAERRPPRRERDLLDSANASVSSAAVGDPLHRAACGEERPLAPEIVGPRSLRPIADAAPLAVERTTYVPIYSSLHLADHSAPTDLGANLSLRNISEHEPVIVTAVDYYDSAGTLVRHFLEEPAELGPLATAEFFISGSIVPAAAVRTSSCAGACVRLGRIYFVEAVMHGRDGAAGISFITEGRIVDAR